MKRLILVPTLMVAALAGCSSFPGTSEDKLSFGQWVTREVVANVVDLATEDSCERNADRSSESVATCKHKKLQRQKAKDAEKREAARQRAIALKRAFDTRDEATDTTEMIEQQRRKTAWATSSQEELAPIMIIKKDAFE